MLPDWMPNRDFLVDQPGRRDKALMRFVLVYLPPIGRSGA